MCDTKKVRVEIIVATLYEQRDDHMLTRSKPRG